MIYKTHNLFYLYNFNVIGGVETYIYEIAKKYHDLDIMVVYRTGDKKQVKRLKKYVPVIKHQAGNEYITDKVFCNYETDILDFVKAKKKIQIVHAMFKTNKLTPRIDERIDQYFAVSDIAAKEWTELTGKKVKVNKNPLTILADEKKPTILLISATRLTPEKGKDRMIKLAKDMDEANINYLWLVFTNDINAIDNPNVVYMKPRLNIRPYIAMVRGKGYGVQLSDCEGDCYFTKECKALGVPIIATPILSFKEQGYEEGKNCWYVPFNMNNTNVERFINIPEVEEQEIDDKWIKELVKSKSTYVYKDDVKVKITSKYYDMQEKRNVDIGEIIECDEERANELVGANVGVRMN